MVTTSYSILDVAMVTMSYNIFLDVARLNEGSLNVAKQKQALIKTKIVMVGGRGLAELVLRPGEVR